MQQLKFKPGCLAVASGGPFFVSATRFTYKRFVHMPGVFLNGLSLRARWSGFAGSYGVSIRADLARRSTYTVSVWRSAEDLHAFVMDPGHVSLMTRYGRRLESSAKASWSTDRFSLSEMWELASAKLTALPSPA
jgi:hypothetical protein